MDAPSFIPIGVAFVVLCTVLTVGGPLVIQVYTAAEKTSVTDTLYSSIGDSMTSFATLLPILALGAIGMLGIGYLIIKMNIEGAAL